MVSPIRHHVDLLEQRENALARQRAMRPGREVQQAAGPSQGKDATHGDLGHARVSAADAAEEAAALARPGTRIDPEHPGSDDAEPSAEDAARVEELKRRDAEVRRHEQAHAAAGGPHAGAPTYDLERGPDGTMYAVGGQVSIDVSPVPGDPEATLQKMRQVRRAALAPADPSPQDRRVAAQAAREETRAREALREQHAGGVSVQPPVDPSADPSADPSTTSAGPAPAAKSTAEPEHRAQNRGSFAVMSLHAKRAYAQADPNR